MLGVTQFPPGFDGNSPAEAPKFSLSCTDAEGTQIRQGEAGYETPTHPAICLVREGRPYADARRNRLYVHDLASEEDRIALTHEYLHLAFAHHPRGQDEAWIEARARRLLQTRAVPAESAP